VPLVPVSPGAPCPRLWGLGALSPWARPVSPDPLPPPAAILEVHEDFFMYKSGIYRHTPVAEGKGPKHRRHGTHSVKITG